MINRCRRTLNLKCLLSVLFLGVVPKSFRWASLTLSKPPWVVSLLYTSHSGGWVMASHCGGFISMMSTDVEFLFMCVLVIWRSPLRGARSALRAFF